MSDENRKDFLWKVYCTHGLDDDRPPKYLGIVDGSLTDGRAEAAMRGNASARRWAGGRTPGLTDFSSGLTWAGWAVHCPVCHARVKLGRYSRLPKLIEQLWSADLDPARDFMTDTRTPRRVEFPFGILQH